MNNNLLTFALLKSWTHKWNIRLHRHVRLKRNRQIINGLLPSMWKSTSFVLTLTVLYLNKSDSGWLYPGELLLVVSQSINIFWAECEQWVLIENAKFQCDAKRGPQPAKSLYQHIYDHPPAPPHHHCHHPGGHWILLWILQRILQKQFISRGTNDACLLCSCLH